MKKFFGFGSSTPPPPPPPSRPPTPPTAKSPPPRTAAIPAIVGHWQEPNGSDTTEFLVDGTVIEKPASGEIIRGRYSLEGAALKIKLEGVSEELSFSASIKNDTLEMKGPDGQITAYRRV